MSCSSVVDWCSTRGPPATLRIMSLLRIHGVVIRIASLANLEAEPARINIPVTEEQCKTEYRLGDKVENTVEDGL
jgi:hypothetical protein